MRKEAAYPVARYSDPNDRRFVSLIERSDEPREGSVNIVGIPYDGAVLGRPGAAGGPAAIRDSVRFFSSFDLETGEDISESKVWDLGDISPSSDGVTAAHAEIEAELKSLFKPDSILAILGGDNSISLPAVKAFSARYGRIGLIVLDSHLDLRGEIDGRPTSGSSYGIALQTVSGLRPSNVVEIGMHGLLNSKQYFEKAKRLGLSVVPASSLLGVGAESAAAEAYEKASSGTEAVYVSVDLDVVDLSQVSGVSAPSVGGISAQYLSSVVRTLASMPKVKALDLVELAPNLDPTGRSQVVAATLLVNIVAGFSSRGIVRL